MDINNKINREDIEVLDTYSAFKQEEIVKVIKRVEDNIIKLIIITNKDIVYVYQVFVNINACGKPSLIVEKLVNTQIL